jgi:Transposase DDE domain
MHVVKLLHNLVKKSCVGIHAKRLSALFIIVMGLTLGSKLSIAGIGRSLNSKAKAKNKIKQVDRLVGNIKLHGKRDKFYFFACKMVINHSKQTPIIVDWSGLPNPNYFLLRAAVPTHGRSLTIYEEVHPKKKQNNHKIHKEFLIKLSKMISQSCKPVIITDAGFHSPFFGEVEKLGWDFVGRIRNLTKYRLRSSKEWFPCKELYKKASKIPKFIGEVILSKSTPIKCFLFLFKGKKRDELLKISMANEGKIKPVKYALKEIESHGCLPLL